MLGGTESILLQRRRSASSIEVLLAAGSSVAAPPHPARTNTVSTSTTANVTGFIVNFISVLLSFKSGDRTVGQSDRETRCAALCRE
jgi:hypothetical protein